MPRRSFLVSGTFYWARPELDPDAPDWMNADQPARFAGYTAEGNETWHWLGVDGELKYGASSWPAEYVGTMIYLHSIQMNSTKFHQRLNYQLAHAT